MKKILLFVHAVNQTQGPNQETNWIRKSILILHYMYSYEKEIYEKELR